MSSAGGEAADNYAPFGNAYAELYEYNAAGAMDAFGMDEDARFTSVGLQQVNGGLVARLPYLAFFASLYSQPVADFRDGLGIRTNHTSFVYCGNTGRLAVDAFSAAKYCVAAAGEYGWLVPHSYRLAATTPTDYDIYETDHALPLAFAYDTAMSRADYEGLDRVEKAEAILQACVLEDDAEDAQAREGAGTQTGAAAGGFTSREVEFTIEPDEGVVVDGASFTTTEADTGVTLRFEGLPKSETYVCLEAPWFDYKTAWNYTFTLASSEREVKTELDTPLHRTYTACPGLAENLGYSEEPLTEIHLSGNLPGRYSFESIRVVCQPAGPLLERLEALQEAGATEVSMGAGRVSARFEGLEEGAYTFFSVPYSSGWRATVDGQPAELVRAGVGFCAVRADAGGTHDIELRYHTPGMGAGAALSCLGLAAFVAICIFERRAHMRPAFLGLYAGMLAVLVVYAIGWQQVIKRLPLTLAFANKAVTVAWGLLWSVLFFHEAISAQMVAGAVLAMAGVALFCHADAQEQLSAAEDEDPRHEAKGGSA